MQGSNSHRLAPGRGAVLGEFELLEELGSGGFAIVYRGWQLRLDREVAVKVLTATPTTDIQDIGQRFMREIDLVKRLEHPNVVRLYDFGETNDGLLWMAMELVRGRELQDLLDQEGAIEPLRAQRIALQLLSGLSEAHEHMIVHRDLKPGNIMLTRKGAERDLVKILDFGVDKALGEHEDQVMHNLTTQGGAFGTPRYMAPEQLKNEDIGPHTDVYASGLILYEMLVGEPAISGTTTFEVLTKQISQPLVFPPWLRRTKVADVLVTATEKDPALRFRTALEFYDAVREAPFASLKPPAKPNKPKSQRLPELTGPAPSAPETGRTASEDIEEELAAATAIPSTADRSGASNPLLSLLTTILVLAMLGLTIWWVWPRGGSTSDSAAAADSTAARTPATPKQVSVRTVGGAVSGALGTARALAPAPSQGPAPIRRPKAIPRTRTP